MGRFLRWNEWRALRESNARKRAVIAALNGTGPELPGSYAASPMTIPAAMDVASSTGVVGKYKGHKRKKKTHRKHKHNMQVESKQTEKRPDYSFDQWMKKIQQLGDQVSDLIKKGEEEDGKIEKKKKEVESKKQEPQEKSSPKNKPSHQDGKKSNEKSVGDNREDNQEQKDKK
jgi:hypothetical protein